MTIGERAALAIKRRVRYGKVKPELDRLTIPHGSYERWKLGKGDPQSFWLQQLLWPDMMSTGSLPARTDAKDRKLISILLTMRRSCEN